MTKDKKYIENLFRNYKKNIARLRILELNDIDDSDNELGGVDYSSVRVQSSNIASLDNIIIAREREYKQLQKDISTTKILLESLTERDYKLIHGYYIEKLTMVRIAQLWDRDDTKTIWNNKERILGELLEVI